MEEVPDHIVANANTNDFASFLKAKEEVAIGKLTNEYEIKMNELKVKLEDEIRKNKNDEESEIVLKHFHYITNEIITLKCPRKNCRATFIFDVGYKDCFALECVTCGCGFCGWCFLDCGSDAHQHVPGCRPGLEPRGLMPPGIIFIITIFFFIFIVIILIIIVIINIIKKQKQQQQQQQQQQKQHHYYHYHHYHYKVINVILIEFMDQGGPI